MPIYTAPVTAQQVKYAARAKMKSSGDMSKTPCDVKPKWPGEQPMSFQVG